MTGDIRIELADDKVFWPDVVKVCHCRAMTENGWDEITAYIQMLIGNVWLPTLEIDDNTPRAVLKLPCQKTWREKDDGRDAIQAGKKEMAEDDIVQRARVESGRTSYDNSATKKCTQVHQISLDELLEQI